MKIYNKNAKEKAMRMSTLHWDEEKSNVLKQKLPVGWPGTTFVKFLFEESRNSNFILRHFWLYSQNLLSAILETWISVSLEWFFLSTYDVKQCLVKRFELHDMFVINWIEFSMKKKQVSECDCPCTTFVTTQVSNVPTSLHGPKITSSSESDRWWFKDSKLERRYECSFVPKNCLQNKTIRITQKQTVFSCNEFSIFSLVEWHMYQVSPTWGAVIKR